MSVLFSTLFIAIWIIVWFFAFGLYYFVLRKKNIRYNTHPILYSVWYLFCASLMLFLARKVYLVSKTLSTEQFSNYIGGNIFSISYVMYGIVVSSLLLIFYYSYVGYKVKNDTYKFMRLGIAKTFEILFQQISFFVIFVLFINTNHPVLYTWFFLVITHLPLLFAVQKERALPFLLGISCAGFIFPLFISQGLLGFLASFLCHILFYMVFTSISFRTREKTDDESN